MSGRTQQPTAAQQEEYLSRLRSEMQAQMAQELMSKMTDNCFKVCTGKSGSGLSSSEEYCMANCTDRYVDVMTKVNEAMVERQNRR